MKKSKIQVLASILALAVLVLAQSCDSPVAAAPATNNTTGGTTITYGWDATTTTYRVDPSLVVGNQATLAVDKATGFLKVIYTGAYGQVLVPLPTTDSQFMGNITKLEVVLSSAASGQKKLTWKVSKSATDSYGTGGANELAAVYRDDSTDWSSSKKTIYFNGSDANFKAFSGYTAPVAVAICSNGSASNALVDAGFTVSYTIESIIFSK